MHVLLPESELFESVLQVDIESTVAFSLERQDSVWTQPYASVHARREMYAQKRKFRVWHLFSLISSSEIISN